MKNLPERDFWNEVKTRLNNYSEMPDDDGWDRIAGALPKAKSSVIGKRWAGIALIFFLGTSTGYLLHQYAPLSGDASASFSTAVSKEEESSADKNAVSNAASREEGRSDQTPSTESSGAAVDKEGSKHSREKEFVAEQNIAGPDAASSVKETRDQTNRNVRIARRKVTTSAGRVDAGTDHETSVPAKRRSEMAGAANSDQRASESSTVITKRSGETSISDNAGDTNAVAPDLASRSGDRDSNFSNSETSISESDRSESGSVVNSNQQVEEQSIAIVTKSEGTTSSDDSKGKASIAARQKSVPGDSIVVDDQEKVVKVASGQNEKKEQKQKKEKRIFHADVYANLTPSLSFQKITPSGNDDLRIIGLESNGVMSGDRFGISLEAGFQRKLTPRLDFYVGLSYYRQKQTLTYEYNGSDVTIEEGGKDGEYAITPMKESKSFQYNMTNAGISSGVMYHLFGDKLMHKIGGGFQFQKGLLRMGSESSYNNEESFYFNYQLSYRLEVQVNKKWNVYLQPTFIHSIISHEELTEPFTIKPYRAGLGIGAIYHF